MGPGLPPNEAPIIQREEKSCKALSFLFDPEMISCSEMFLPHFTGTENRCRPLPGPDF